MRRVSEDYGIAKSLSLVSPASLRAFVHIPTVLGGGLARRSCFAAWSATETEGDGSLDLQTGWERWALFGDPIGSCWDGPLLTSRTDTKDRCGSWLAAARGGGDSAPASPAARPAHRTLVGPLRFSGDAGGVCSEGGVDPSSRAGHGHPSADDCWMV